jgi:hypothetical protein
VRNPSTRKALLDHTKKLVDISRTLQQTIEAKNQREFKKTKEPFLLTLRSILEILIPLARESVARNRETQKGKEREV